MDTQLTLEREQIQETSGALKKEHVKKVEVVKLPAKEDAHNGLEADTDKIITDNNQRMGEKLRFQLQMTEGLGATSRPAPSCCPCTWGCKRRRRPNSPSYRRRRKSSLKYASVSEKPIDRLRRCIVGRLCAHESPRARAGGDGDEDRRAAQASASQEPRAAPPPTTHSGQFDAAHGCGAVLPRLAGVHQAGNGEGVAGKTRARAGELQIASTESQVLPIDTSVSAVDTVVQVVTVPQSGVR